MHIAGSWFVGRCGAGPSGPDRHVHVGRLPLAAGLFLRRQPCCRPNRKAGSGARFRPDTVFVLTLPRWLQDPVICCFGIRGAHESESQRISSRSSCPLGRGGRETATGAGRCHSQAAAHATSRFWLVTGVLGVQKSRVHARSRKPISTPVGESFGVIRLVVTEHQKLGQSKRRWSIAIARSEAPG